MKKHSTKKALLASALSLLLCFSMLIGTTFAWFTDSVVSTNNIIKSGNLDVELYYQAEGQTDWTKVTESTNVFKDSLWEPGHTEVVKLKVVNEGTLALKYQLGVNVASEIGSVNVNNKDFRLSEFIKFGIVDGAQNYTREQAVAAVDATATALKTAYGSDTISLEPTNNGDTDEKTVTMVVYMPETVGNDANYKKGAAVPTIHLGINLMATQFTAEGDSFGSDYDANAPFGTYVELNAGDDLLAAMANAEKGMPLTIKLKGNVEWPTEGHIGENDVTKASSILIDGNGYTITATGSGVTPLGDDKAPMTLKNVTIVDNSVSYNEGAWEFTYLELGGSSLTCENVTFADEIQTGTNATFTNCTFESNEENVYAVWVEDGSAAFTNCTFTGYRGLKAHEDYGTEISSVIVKDCTFQNISKKPGIALGRICMNGVTYTTGATTYTNTTDTTVSITGSTFMNCQAGDQGKYIYETDTDVATFNFVNENNTVLNNATVVSTKDALLALSAKALTGNNGTAEEAIIVIGADIDMAGAEFSAIIAQRGDKLTVLGNGHKISNVKIVSGANDNTTGQASMFYAYPDSTLTVSDLTLEDITVTADANDTGYAAAVVGYCEGAAILNNVDVVNATVTGVKSSGMLAGHLSGSLTATDCDLSGTVTLADFAEEANGHYAGKYLGTKAGTLTLTDCTANVTVSGNLSAKNFGDIFGRNVSGSMTLNVKEGETLDLLAKDYGTVTLGTAKNVAINGVAGTTAIFKTDANTKLENVTLKDVEFKYTGATVDCGIVIDANAQIDNLVLEGCTFTGTGAKAGRGLSGLNNNATIVLKDCTFKDLGYPVYAWGGYEALTLENCTFDNIKSWAIMPQSGFDGDLTVTGCTFKNCIGGGLIKAGTLTAGHTFTFTNNTVTGCTVAGDHNWFQFNASAGTSVISGNTKDGAAWTPTTADGLTV